MNNLLDNLSSTAKPFAGDTSIFSVIYNVNTFVKQLCANLKKKMLGFQMINKEVLELIFSHKSK